MLYQSVLKFTHEPIRNFNIPPGSPGAFTLLNTGLCSGQMLSDISKLLYIISRAVRRLKFETILKYHEWYLCQISRTNHAIICLYYYPQKVCNFHM